MLRKGYVILYFITILLFANISVFAEILYTGSCGEEIFYTVSDNYELNIVGNGAMTEYKNAVDTDIPWKDYRSQIISINIQDGITSIGKSTFANCRKLTKVSLPNSIENISKLTFLSCESLPSITLPKNLSTIADSLFYACKSLSTIRLYNNIKAIEVDAFGQCDSLQTVYFYGTEEEWNAIEISDGNEALLKAKKVFVSEVQPTSISISSKSRYIIGEDTELDITVSLNYNDGTSTLLSPDEYTLETDFNPDTEGRYTVKVTYGDFTDEITVKVEPLRIAKIEITTPPDKTEFVEGTDLDLSGMVVTATYSNATTEDITDKCEITGYDSSAIGTQKLTISYEGFSCTLNVKIVEKSMVGIRIVSPPTKSRYSNDETELDLTGLAVEALYDNDTVSEIADYTVSGFDGTKAGTQTITVSYNGFTAEFEVFVKVYEYKADSEISKNYDFETQTLTVGTTITSRTESGAVKVIVAVYDDNNALMKATIKDVFFDTKEQKQLNIALEDVSYPFGKIKVFVWGYDLMKMIPMALGV